HSNDRSRDAVRNRHASCDHHAARRERPGLVRPLHPVPSHRHEEHPMTPTITPATIEDLLSRVPRSSYVDGAFLGGTPELDVVDPATGEALTQVVDADAASVGMSALDAAVAAQDEWAQTLPRERSEILRRAYELCHERADDLAALMTLEMGKPLAESYGEVTYGAEFLRWFAEEAVRQPGRFRHAPSAEEAVLTVARPVGPSLLITPWNFPLSMGTRKIGPALAAGCTVVLKPAQKTPLTSLALMSILAEAGLPRGVVNCVVTSDSKALSSTLMPDARLRNISFTGSTGGRGTLLAQAWARPRSPCWAPRGSWAAAPPSWCCARRTSTPRSTRRCSASSATAARPAARRIASTCTPRSPGSSRGAWSRALVGWWWGPGST